MMRRPVAMLALVASVVAPAAAQSTDAAAKRNLLSINPLGIPFELLTAEYERATSSRVTVGVAGNYFGGWYNDDYSLSSADIKLRFYPNEEALRGFSIGVAAGVLRRSDERTVSCSSTSCETDTVSESWPALAVLADYNFFLGRRKDFLVGLGFGAKRTIGNSSDFFDVVVIPSVRFQTGFRF
jgi:hypothetical protein